MKNAKTVKQVQEVVKEDVGNLVQVDVAGFGRTFLERFLAQGFGSLTKREVEVLVLNLLKKQELYAQQSNFALSKALKLPESKVSGLLYEAVLLFERDHDTYFQNGLLKALQKIKPKVKRSGSKKNDENFFAFVLEDKFVRAATHARLKDLGHFADGSFNTEIVSISETALFSLLESFIDDAAAERLNNELNDEIAKLEKNGNMADAKKAKAFAEAFVDANNRISAKGLFKKALEGAAQEGAKATVKWLTGGGFATVVDGVLSFANFLREDADMEMAD